MPVAPVERVTELVTVKFGVRLLVPAPIVKLPERVNESPETVRPPVVLLAFRGDEPFEPITTVSVEPGRALVLQFVVIPQLPSVPIQVTFPARVWIPWRRISPARAIGANVDRLRDRSAGMCMMRMASVAAVPIRCDLE